MYYFNKLYRNGKKFRKYEIKIIAYMDLLNIKEFELGEVIFTIELVRFVNDLRYKLFIDRVNCSGCISRQNFVIHNWKNILNHLEKIAKESLECIYIR